MFDMIASVLTGGATGIVGSLIGTVGRYFDNKQKIKQMSLEFDQEYKLQELQITSRKEELESEEAIARMETNAAMKTASYAHDASYGPASVTIASILRFVRPVLTFVLLGFVVYIFWQANDDKALVFDLSNQIMFLTTTAYSTY